MVHVLRGVPGERDEAVQIHGPAGGRDVWVLSDAVPEEGGRDWGYALDVEWGFCGEYGAEDGGWGEVWELAVDGGVC